MGEVGLSRLSASSHPKGDLKEMREKSTQADMVFLNEKTMSSGFKALIPNPLSRSKLSINIKHNQQPSTTQRTAKTVTPKI
jgi:hypothetical protein